MPYVKIFGGLVLMIGGVILARQGSSELADKNCVDCEEELDKVHAKIEEDIDEVIDDLG